MILASEGGSDGVIDLHMPTNVIELIWWVVVLAFAAGVIWIVNR